MVLNVKWTNRKIPVVSPGLIQLRKGFWVGLKNEGLISGWGGGGGGRGGLISGIEKRFQTTHASVYRNTFLS